MPTEPLKSFIGKGKTLFLLDISSFIFRAFFAIRSLSNSKGEPTNAVYGVASMLAKLVDEADPSFMAVAYDSKEPSFRHEMYEEYKANRSEPPEDLVPQFARIDELVRCMEIHSFRQHGLEADDLIATLTHKWCALAPEHRVVIVTGDKDLMQLVNGRVRIWDTMANRFYGEDEVRDKMGVAPARICDYLALVGDSSDNVPGVPGIGPKGACQLIEEFGGIEEVIAAAKAGRIKGKKGESIAQHEEDARLSYRLVCLKEDAALKVDEDDFRYRFTVTPACESLLGELEFPTLLDKWHKRVGGAAASASARFAVPEEKRLGDHPSSVVVSSGGVTQDFRTISTEADFLEVLEAIERAGRFAVDLETTSLDPFEAEICGVAIAYEASHGLYIPVGHSALMPAQLPREYVLSKLKPFLEDPRYGKIGQNLKYDWMVLHRQGIRASGILADTMVAAYVVDAAGRYNMDALAAKYLGYTTMTFEDVCGKGKDQICFSEVPIETATRYSAEDALVTWRLWETLEPILRQEGLYDVFSRIDLPLVEILTRMELKGVCIDSEWFSRLSREFEVELKAIEERIGAYTEEPVNLNSPKQLAELLFNKLGLPTQSKTKTGFSTDAKVLEALEPLHEVPRLLLEYREISKLKGTYVDPLPQMIEPRTGRIHAGFHQTVAATGRLSSSDPNLQNIPIRTERGRRIRRGFVPSPGNVLLSADYSQIELRILAHMSGDKDLSDSFRKGEDVHRRTASEIFDVAPEAVDDQQRAIAKAINFGLMYGKTAFGLAAELKISRSEAKDIIDRYFERYSAVKRFLDGLIRDAAEKGYVTTASGRKRALPDIRSRNPAIRANAERMAMNTPIQGTAADLMKLAMIAVDRELEKNAYRAKVIIQVHDELVLDCPKEELADVERLVVRCMEGAMKLDVPLVVNSGSGVNWMEA